MTIAHQASHWRALIDLIQRSACAIATMTPVILPACCLVAGGAQ
ncbi:hypothetical protein [Sphaerotilus sp.]|nr:hypothetical protein [Sphaerotilus sp.]